MLRHKIKHSLSLSVVYILILVLAFVYNPGYGIMNSNFTIQLCLGLVFVILLGIIASYGIYEVSKIIKLPITITFSFLICFNFLLAAQFLIISIIFHGHFLNYNSSYLVDLDLLAFHILLIIGFFSFCLFNKKYHDLMYFINSTKKFIFFSLYLLTFIFNLAINSLSLNLSPAQGQYFGWEYLLLIFAIAIITDSSANIFGVYFGKTPISKFSPAKSLEASVFSTCFTIILLTGIFALIHFLLTPIFLMHLLFIMPAKEYIIVLQFVLIILGLNIMAQYGDLFFSRYKRILQVKDYGSLIPYHGGVFDRIDSVIFITIIMFLFISVI